MTITTFDTLAYSKILQEAGILQSHAEALAKAQKLAIDEMLAVKEIATQADIFRLENKIKSNKHEILKWMISGMAAQTALLIAIFAFFK